MSAPGIKCLNSVSARASVSQLLYHHCAKLFKAPRVGKEERRKSVHSQDAIAAASRALQSSLGARPGRDQHEQALQGEHLPGRYEFYLRHAMGVQTPMCTCVKRVKIERNAHQDAIVTDSRALKRSLCSRTGRDQHEQAFQGKRLPSGNDITAAAA